MCDGGGEIVKDWERIGEKGGGEIGFGGCGG